MSAVPSAGGSVRVAFAPDGRGPSRPARGMGEAFDRLPGELGTELLGLIAHELRTPLTVILGMSHLLANGSVDPSMAREAGADIALNAVLLDELLDSLMVLAQPASGGLPEDSEPIILAAVAAQALAAVSPRYPNGEFTLEVVDRGAVVEAPATWVASAINNLVTNAAKYGGAEPVVTVRVQREEERAVLRVLDRGAGFSQPEADRLFEPFFRTASARRQAQGTGLGLALVDRVVRRLDGTVWARPRQGGGAEVGFALPIVATTTAPMRHPARVASGSGTGTRRSAPRG